VDPASDGVIDLPYPVSGKDHYSLIVFQGPQEHIDERVSIDILD
jgi:hypothetical protein